MTITTPPSSVTGDRPATYASALVAWAGDEPDRLAGAFLAGNGHTQRAMLRRVRDDQLQSLRAVLAQGEPMPFSTTPFGVWDVTRELRRRGLA